MLNLIALTMSYIGFMSDVGSTNDINFFQDQVPNIFVADVVKIENGKTILIGRDDLIVQLNNARKYGFPWSMQVLDIVCDEKKNTSAVRFSWDSKKVGPHITTAILKFNQDGKIMEINEVYNQFADITH